MYLNAGNHATGAWHKKNTSAKRENPATVPRRRRSAKHPFLSCHASVGDHGAENMRPTNGNMHAPRVAVKKGTGNRQLTLQRWARANFVIVRVLRREL